MGNVVDEAKARGEAIREEIIFFRDVVGWDDRRIAEKLGMKWDTYKQFRRRHPELGPIRVPDERDDGWWQLSRRLRGR